MGLCLGQPTDRNLSETKEKNTAFEWNQDLLKEAIYTWPRTSKDLIEDLYAEDRKRQLAEYENYIKILECR